MGILAKNAQPLRRKTDIEAWEKTIEHIALQLCPAGERQAEEWRQKQLARRSKSQVLFFPVWRKYRNDAIKVAHIQQAVPLLKHFPLQISRVLGAIVYK